MKRNIGTTDKVIRILVALVIAILYFTHLITGTISIVLLVFAGIFLLTGLFGICPLYVILGLNTKTEK